MRGDNLKAGNPDGDIGRVLGGKARAKQYNALPRPENCPVCETMGYKTMAQHNGHKGFRAVMDNHPTALHSIREKIARTGRKDSRERWEQISS